MGKLIYVQVPKAVISDPVISSIDFCLLVRFKFLQYRSKGKNPLEIDMNELKRVLGLNDTRTLKKSLNNLYKQGYITNDIVIHRSRSLLIELNRDRIKLNNNFTQLPLSLFSKLDVIGHHGFRLLFYYESFVNRNRDNKQFCYAALDRIHSDTGISRKTIVKYNDILIKCKLLKLEKHQLTTDYQYDESGELIFNKFNNHYAVRLENLL